MSKPRGLTPGKARTCPHCRATILESASVCPACRHHLRLDPKSPQHEWATFVPLRVEGKLQHTAAGEPWEYSVVLAIRDEKGDEITRQALASDQVLPAQDRKQARQPGPSVQARSPPSAPIRSASRPWRSVRRPAPSSIVDGSAHSTSLARARVAPV